MESIIDKSKQDQKFVYEEDKIFNLNHVEAFLPELICGICNNILKNPIECKNWKNHCVEIVKLTGSCKTLILAHIVETKVSLIEWTEWQEIYFAN